MSVRHFGSPRFLWLALIGLAVLLRLGVMLARPERLTEDRDLYLGIANEIRAGHGYATPGSDPPRPTAFRPPLYPILLALTGGSRAGIGTLHLLLAAVMVVATGLAAERLAGQWGNVHRATRFIAGGIVAIDPMLLLYSGQPMTETLCSGLTAVLLWGLASRLVAQDEMGFQREGEAPAEPLLPEGVDLGSGSAGASSSRAIVAGLMWGLCLLGRPTYAAGLGLWLAGSVFLGWRERVSVRPRLRCGLVVGVVALAVVAPWAIRNWSVFGQPIVTTTHGGYTLWLANNPVYYSEVIEGPDAVWSGESLNRWQTETNAEMDRLQIQGEVARDEWQSARAKQFMLANPWRFVRACLYRGVTFWSIWPGRSVDPRVPVPMLWVIAGWYAALWVGGVVATLRVIRGGQWRLLLPAFSLILGFAAVHWVYWTDARMRAPVMPAVAVLVAVGMGQRGGCTAASRSAADRS